MRTLGPRTRWPAPIVAAICPWMLVGAAGCATGASDPAGGGDAAHAPNTSNDSATASSASAGQTPPGPGDDGGANASAVPANDADAPDGGNVGVPGADDSGEAGGDGPGDVADVAAQDTSTSASDGQANASDGGCPGLFCEDFEKGTLDPAIWNAQANGGQTVAVESTVVAHGKHAVHFHANPNVVSYDFIITKSAPIALRGHHFGRAYFNVTPKPPAAHTEFLFAGTPGFPKLKYLEVAGIGTGWQLTFVDLVGGGESYASGGAAPTSRWICLEWEFNDAPDQATVFVDGVQSFTRSSILFKGMTTGLVGGFSDFGFGFYAWHPATYPFDLYYDDIVLDTKRIGCLSGP